MKIKPELENVAQHVLDNAADYPLLAARCAPLEDVKQHVLDNAAELPPFGSEDVPSRGCEITRIGQRRGVPTIGC